jgi:cyanate permease
MFKRNVAAAAIGIFLLCGFLGILMWWIKSPPIIVIMLGVIGMMLYDIYLSLVESRNQKN